LRPEGHREFASDGEHESVRQDPRSRGSEQPIAGWEMWKSRPIRR
jgi:hypothetical protein